MKGRKRYLTWCKEDPNDQRKINYKCHYDGRDITFTSDDNMSYSMLRWLQNWAMIDNIELRDNEWYVELSE